MSWLNPSTYPVLLGLSPSTSTTLVPNHAPYYIIANFVLAYAVLSTRGTKVRMGIDHNVSPREDVTKYGEEAVRRGKITRAALDRLKRREGAHANAVENFPLLVGALLFASYARLPAHLINLHALIYTVDRIAFAIAYAGITDRWWSYLRSVLWWAGNIACLRLLWLSAPAINA